MYAKSSKVPQARWSLSLTDEEKPVRHPEAGEVAIDVAAVGLNRAPSIDSASKVMTATYLA
jgi:hypothetical protein